MPDLNGGSASRVPALPSRHRPAFGVSLVVHILVAAAIAWPFASRLSVNPRKAERAISTFIVSPAEDGRFPGLNPVAPLLDDWAIPRGDDASTLHLASFDIDVSKISERAQVLFPFLTPGLSLEQLTPLPQQTARSSLVNPLGHPRRAAEKGAPLVMDNAALQSLIDKAWSRHERWAAFEPLSRIAAAHDPDAGRVPDMLRMYCYQNSLQPYADRNTRDPRLWAQLGLAADHVSFIGFIREYAAAHPATKATTELLFLLDHVAEANRDALNALLDSNPVETLGWTRAGNAKAFQLVSRIRFYYQQELNRRGLMSDQSIDVFYEQTRLAILGGIVRTTPGGYRADDARFLIGAIHWKQGNPAEALRWWRQMTGERGDGEIVAALQLAAALRSPGYTGAALDGTMDSMRVREIERILRNEHSRWVDFSSDRLKRFGYRFDTF